MRTKGEKERGEGKKKEKKRQTAKDWQVPHNSCTDTLHPEHVLQRIWEWQKLARVLSIVPEAKDTTESS